MRWVVLSSVVLVTAGCRDLSRFSSGQDHYEGSIVRGDFVRAGIADDVRACVTLDTDHLEDTPGTIATSDGTIELQSLRVIPQVWHDPISTLSFGEGREKNLLYGVTTAKGEAMAVVSLMTNGELEVRLVRGAPPGQESLFGVFHLARTQGPCSF